jgi:hypothetical protein
MAMLSVDSNLNQESFLVELKSAEKERQINHVLAVRIACRSRTTWR